MSPDKIRNIGIIAHVDHGKTTLVDALFKQAGLFAAHQKVEDRVMDRNDLERERGITILSKVASVRLGDVKVNIVDTPGHADFGGEVERVISMVDGVLLIVDACEGPRAQTRFVLKKALDAGKKPVIFVNKIDREMARPKEAYDAALDLLIDLGADEEALEYPVLYGSGIGGFARTEPDGEGDDLTPLFEAILNDIPPPDVEPEGPVRLLVNNLDADDYLGRMFGGKLLRGTMRVGDRLAVHRSGSNKEFTASALWTYEGLSLSRVEQLTAGDIVMTSGIDDVLISDSICDAQFIEPLPRIEVEPSTIRLAVFANDSPFTGQDGGKYLTIEKIRERIEKEERVSVSLEIDKAAPRDRVMMQARGEMQLSVLIETMRREGYEMTIARPEVIMKDGKEPVEILTCDVPEEGLGSVLEELSRRQADIENMEPQPDGSTRVTARIPTRGLIGFRSTYLSLTRGLGLMTTLFAGYEPQKGGIRHRVAGALVNKEPGKITKYAYEDVQERGHFFHPPGTDVYGGMIIGQCNKAEDLLVNATKQKHATNMRSATKEATVVLDAHHEVTLEQALSWIRDDELLEVTPGALRLRKRILDHSQRRVEERKAAAV